MAFSCMDLGRSTDLVLALAVLKNVATKKPPKKARLTTTLPDHLLLRNRKRSILCYRQPRRQLGPSLIMVMG